MLEANHLLTFAVVAQAGSLSKAAQQLHRSQPAISAQLKELQEAVGEHLYTRHRHGISLTATGQRLLPYAQSMRQSLEGARLYVKELKEGLTGRLRIAASTTIAMYLLPKHLKTFYELNPGLELHLMTCNTQEALELLKASEAELALIEGPDDEAALEHSVISTDEIVLAVAKQHMLSDYKVLKKQDLQGLEVVRREYGSGTRAVVDAALMAEGIATKTILEAKGVDAVKEAILQGFGAGFISKLAVEREAAMGLLTVFSLPFGGFTRPLSLIHPKKELCSQVTLKFITFLTQQLQ